MTEDRDLAQITRLASMPAHEAGTELVQHIVNHCLAIGYSVGWRPEVIAVIALQNCASVLAEIPEGEWQEVCMRIAGLLEQQAHEEAA